MLVDTGERGVHRHDPVDLTLKRRATLHVGEVTMELDPAPTAFVVTRWGVHYLAEGSLWWSEVDDMIADYVSRFHGQDR